jgi:hypothetical protein
MDIFNNVFKIGAILITAIITAVISVYRDEILNFVLGGRKFAYLKGEWKGSWKILGEGLELYKKENVSFGILSDLPKEAGEEIIQDVLTIEKVYGNMVKGTGRHPTRGTWKFDGTITNATITCSYTSKSGNFVGISGVFILKIDEDRRNILEGRWIQSNTLNEETLLAGETRWIKIKSKK